MPVMNSPNPSARRLRRRLLAALAAMVVAAACDDPFKIEADTANLDANLELWALNGSPAAYPSAVIVAQAAATRPDASGSFDLAFDIDANGRVRTLPVASVVTPVSGARTIEFQRITGPFDAVEEAPRSGWTADSVLVLEAGEAFLVKVPTVYCQYDIRQEVFAKFRVDSILPAERRIKLSGRVNPNCGFRSLLTGIPEF